MTQASKLVPRPVPTAASNQDSPVPAWVLLDGACNVRDLGGYPTSDGGRVRRGLVYRADSVHRLSEEDVLTLEALGITTVIDLRRDDEVARLGRGPVAAWASVVFHVPLPEGPAATEQRSSGPGGPADLEYLYQAYARHGARELALVLGVLAGPRSLPALVHCYAGKDRTGVVAALLLSLLGVEEDLVVADYAASSLVRDRFLTLVATDLERLAPAGPSLDPADPRLDANPQTMRSFLRWLTEHYGGAEGYAQWAGVDAEKIAALRDRLVDAPGPAAER
jgi:protein-tyrosine phosphatase